MNLSMNIDKGEIFEYLIMDVINPWKLGKNLERIFSTALFLNTFKDNRLIK